MPSGEIVEIDAADNDVAILDASAIALAAASTSAADGSGGLNEHNSVSQSQDDANDDEEEATGPIQVSPMPKASVVTPRRKKTGKMGGKSSSADNNDNSTNSNNPATPPAKNKAATSRTTGGVAVATPPGTDSAKKGKKIATATAVSVTKKPAKTLHSFFSKAGPSAKKTKTVVAKSSGGTKAKTSSVSAKATAKATSTPVATVKKGASKKTVEPSSKAPETPAAKENGEDNVKASSSISAPAKTAPSTPAATAKKGASKKIKEPPNGKAADKPVAKDKEKVSNDKAAKKKSPTAAKTGKKADEVKAKSAKKPTKKAPVTPKPKVRASTSSKGSEDPLDSSPMYAVMMASRTMSAGRRRKSAGKSVLEELPLASAAVEDAEVNAKGEVEVVEKSDSSSVGTAVDEDKDTNAANKANVSAVEVEVIDVSGDNSDDDSKGTISSSGVTLDENDGNDVIINAKRSGEQESDSMDADASVATVIGDENDSTTTESSTANARDNVIDVDCEKENTSVPDEKVTDSTSNDADSDDDATVAFEEEGTSDKATAGSDVSVEEGSSAPAEIDQPLNINDSTDKQVEPLEDEEVVVVDATKQGNNKEASSNDEAIDEPKEVEVTKKTDSKEPSEEDNAKEASDEEVTIIDTPKVSAKKSIKSKNKSTKPAPKSRKKAATASKRPTKKKATPATDKKKGIFSIAASLKNMAAQPAKKSKAAPEKQEVSAQRKSDTTSSTSVSVESKGDTVSAAKPTFSKAAASGTAPNKTSNAASSASRKAAVTVTPDIANLSEENASRLRHYTTLREKYVARAAELAERPNSDDFVEEVLSLETAEGLTSLEKGSVEVAEDGEFPDALLTHLLLLVQGRSLPLSDMAKQALDELIPYTTDTRPLTIESISSKIKLLAQRKSYIAGKPPAPSEKTAPISKLDCFENVEECYMWRWELSSIELIPQNEASKVRKARAIRKKLQGHYKAIMNLIAAVDKAVTWLQNSASKSSIKATGDKLTAKVSDSEEKVLKYEREEEKARLLNEAKLQKQKGKAQEQAEKQKGKERLEQERLAEKKRKDEEKERKKLEATKDREEAKKKKNDEKEQEKLKKKQETEEKETKRKARLMSFFGGGKKKKQKVTGSATKQAIKSSIPSFDSETFRKQIDSQDEHIASNPFSKLSNRSKQSRRRKTGYVRVSVFITVVSENAFAPQPYDEERIITVPNRYKFLGFHEDVRPPYRGTWSKRSEVVSGRRPYAKDTKHMDYENDSEAEWEEGDDEEGEDLQDGDDGVDEEDDMQDDDNDGFIAAEDDLGIEDEDVETRDLRKKNLSNSLAGKRSHFKACVVAPRMGGLPHENFSDNMQCVIEGFSSLDAMDALTLHAGYVVTPDASICLDAFPPSDSAKDSNQSKKDSTAQNKEMTTEAQQIMAKFVHNSTHTSKEIIVTELLKAHPTVTNSRAQAIRELEVIAEKRRRNGGGFLWEVKNNHLKKLGLKKKDLKKPPKEASPPSDGADKKGKEKKDPNAPKRNMSAYIFYSSATRADVRAGNPDVSFGETAQIISKNFKALSSEERECWDKKAAEDKERYQKEMAEYSAKTATSSENKTTDDLPTKVPSAQQTTKNPSSATKKRKKSGVSKASANLFASFLVKKTKKQKTA